MNSKRNYFQFVIATVLCLLFIFNSILIRPLITEPVVAQVNVEQTTEMPETAFKVNVYDGSLIDEQEKHESVNNSLNSITNNTSGLTPEQLKELKTMCIVGSNVEYMLIQLGFTVFEAQAYDIDKNCWYDGYVYTDYELYTENNVIAGFVIIDNNLNINENANLIAFNNDNKDENRYIITRNNLDLVGDHFIFENQYVKYQWKNCFLVNYSTSQNVKTNYDKSLGRLYSYDDNKYVYENDFTYTSQEVSLMFNEIDFDELQKTIDEINAEQEKNGYYVSEITITYIDMQLIEEWERCSDKDSFYGYDLDQINKQFGRNTTLEFTSEGIKKATLIEPTNWLKAWLMVLAGCAAIVIGAALAPLTGGCSFGASLVCIMKMTAIAMVTDLLIKTTVSTITNVVNGQNFWDALGKSVKSTFTVENIASSFMVAAIMSSVMVGSGLVKACFVEGTPVLTENGYKSIESLSVGDKVLSYSELTGMVALKEVTETISAESNDICSIALDSGETITSTSLHPWYVQNKGWTPAYALTSSDNLLTENGQQVKIIGVNRQKLNNPIKVYNITVDDVDAEDYHTYFVGNDEILVHNSCAQKPTTNNSQKPVENHHFLTNKSKKWTPEFKKITDKYGLNLNDKSWNIEAMAHHGRHATEYHKAMLEQLQNIDDIAQGNKEIFLELFKGIKQKVMDTPAALYKAFWKNGGKLF